MRALQGDYDIAIRPAGSDAGADPVITGSATVQAGQNASIVAHLDAGGRPTLRMFANNRSEIPAGQARVSVRHTAAAPAVDILAGGSPVIEGLENPNAESLEVDAGSVEVGVAPAGESDPVIGPQTLDLAAGGNYAVYAIGSLEDGTTSLIGQQVGSAAGAPGGVAGGNSGLLGGEDDPAALVALLAAAGALLTSGSLLILRRRAEAGR